MPVKNSNKPFRKRRTFSWLQRRIKFVGYAAVRDVIFLPDIARNNEIRTARISCSLPSFIS